MNEREISLCILTDILDEKAYNNIMLRKTLNKNKQLSRIQKAFITELTNGTLRNIILIDYVINQFSKTKTDKMKTTIVNILRLAVYQIMFMDKVPTSAACNEAVNITKRRGFKNLSGFVNGVLRNISKNIDNIKYPDPEKDKINFLCTKYSYPNWIIKYWLNELDYDAIKSICINNNIPPKVSICLNNSIADKKELENCLLNENVKVTDGVFGGTYISNISDITNTFAYKKGMFHIIDQSSILCVNILDPKQNNIIYDVCAAPGGKSFKCSYILNNTGKIISRDIYQHKIDIMNENIKRLNIKNIVTELKDAKVHYTDDEQKADCVIIDVPCSGLGLIRKKPDIKYNKSIYDIDKLVKIQRKIVDSCWNYVKVGGTLLYSTCTISRKENIENFNWILQNYPFKAVDISSYLPVKFDTASKGYIQILPNMFGTDGFFIAKFKRV